MLATCTTVRGELGREYAAQTHKFLASLAKDVAAYRRAMAHKIAKTRKNVAADRQAMMSQITRWASARSKASNLLHHDLERQATSIMNKTAELRSGLADAHGRMAKHQRASLKSGHQKLRADTAQIRQCNARRPNEGACQLVEFPGRGAWLSQQKFCARSKARERLLGREPVRIARSARRKRDKKIRPGHLLDAHARRRVDRCDAGSEMDTKRYVFGHEQG